MNWQRWLGRKSKPILIYPRLLSVTIGEIPTGMSTHCDTLRNTYSSQCASCKNEYCDLSPGSHLHQCWRFSAEIFICMTRLSASLCSDISLLLTVIRSVLDFVRNKIWNSTRKVYIICYFCHSVLTTNFREYDLTWFLSFTCATRSPPLVEAYICFY